MAVPDWAPGTCSGRARATSSCSSRNRSDNECREVAPAHASSWTSPTESTPFSVSTFECPRPPATSAAAAGASARTRANESFTPVFYGRLVFIAYFNAGVRAVDIRDPFHPREVGLLHPADHRTGPTSAAWAARGDERCKIAIQTNNVEVDDRGYIYIADRADTGLHILRADRARARDRQPAQDQAMGRFIDLSVTVDSNTMSPPSTNMRLEVTPHRRGPGFWQVSSVHQSLHTGAHIDSPLHVFKNGITTAEISLDQVMGEALVVDLSWVGANHAITIDDLKKGGAGDVKRGDIVLLRTDWTDKMYGHVARLLHPVALLPARGRAVAGGPRAQEHRLRLLRGVLRAAARLHLGGLRDAPGHPRARAWSSWKG